MSSATDSDQHAAQSASLRWYQSQALAEIRSAFFDRGLNRLLVVHPTGSGKTVVFSHLLRDPDIALWLSAFPEHERRILVVAHRVELLDQAASAITRFNPSLVVDIEQGARCARPDADVVVASIGTIGRQSSRRLQMLNPSRFRIVIIDEAHRAAAASYRSLLSSLNLSDDADRPLDRLLIGFTATPDRYDQVGLSVAFDEIVHGLGLIELIKDGVLADLNAHRVHSAVSLADVATLRGDFVDSELARAVNTVDRNRTIVHAYRSLAPSVPAIAFCASVQHAEELASVFRSAGIPSASVSGNMLAKERAATVAAFKAGDIAVITNCLVLSEGFDHPDVACIIQARPTKSRVLYMQMIGRGTRRTQSKHNCIVIDIVDNWAKHSVITMPSLLGLPPQVDLAGRSVASIATPGDVVADSEFDLSGVDTLDDIEVLTMPVPLWESSGHAVTWVVSRSRNMVAHLGYPIPGRVVLSVGSGGYCLKTVHPRIRDGAETFWFSGHISLTNAPADIQPMIGVFESCDAAQQYVEQRLSEELGRRERFLARRQAARADISLKITNSFLSDAEADAIAHPSLYDSLLRQTQPRRLRLAIDGGYALWITTRRAAFRLAILRYHDFGVAVYRNSTTVPADVPRFQAMFDALEHSLHRMAVQCLAVENGPRDILRYCLDEGGWRPAERSAQLWRKPASAAPRAQPSNKPRLVKR